MKQTCNGLLLLIAGCLLGCASPVMVEDSLEADIYPLAVGNSWSYLFSAFENETLDDRDTFFVEITGTETIDFEGRKLNVFVERKSRSSSPAHPFTQLLRFEEEGLYRYFKGTPSYGVTRQLLLKHPAAIGDSWQIDYGDYADVLTYESPEVIFTTPAGSFSSHAVSNGTGGSWWARRYYAPEVGFVGLESEAEISSGVHTQRMELLDYVLN